MEFLIWPIVVLDGKIFKRQTLGRFFWPRISALHDFVIGPKATNLRMKNPESVDAFRMRKLASWIGRINLLLALIVVMLGVILVRGGL